MTTTLTLPAPSAIDTRRPSPRSVPIKTISDAGIVLRQQLGLTMRSPSWLVIGIVQPFLYLLLFAPLLRTALKASSTAQAYATFVPGLLVLLVMGASLYAGVGMINEVRSGIFDRCRVTSVSRTSLLLGRVARDVVTYLVQVVLVLVLAVAAGMRADAAGVLLSLLVLSVVAASLSSVSYVIALSAAHEGAMSGMLQMVTQPLMLLSGIMLPLSLGPGWLRVLADVNPLSHVVDGSRNLFAGQFTTSAVWWALGLTAGLGLASISLCCRKFAVALR